MSWGGRMRDRLLYALWAVTTLAIGAAIWLVFLYAPEERVMGAPQRIFYFHVPLAMMTFLAVFVLLVGSVGYLWTRQRAWDDLSRASSEVGLLFCTLVLITGPIWAKPAWGVWWTWEARLTTTLLLWLLLVGGQMVRSYASNREQGARLGAVVGVIASLDVPIVYKAVDWWRGQHPIVFGPGKSDPLAAQMRQTFLYCMAVFFLFYALLLVLRMRLAACEDRVHDAEQLLAARAEGAR
jgi:heme exporter protein C